MRTAFGHANVAIPEALTRSPASQRCACEGRCEQAKRAGMLDGLAAPSVPGRDRRARHASTRGLARRHAARLTARQHEPAVVADRPPMYLRWTPHVPGLQPTPTTCAAAGRHRCSRACEVHARYEAGTSPEAMSAVRQLEPGHAAQLSKTAASPRGCPGPSKPSDQRSASRTRSARPAKCHGLPDHYPSQQRTAFPAARAPGKHGAAGRTHGDARPTRQRASSRNTPPAPPVRGRPWKTGGYTDRPGGPHAVRYASVDAAPQRPTA